MPATLTDVNSLIAGLIHQARMLKYRPELAPDGYTIRLEPDLRIVIKDDSATPYFGVWHNGRRPVDVFCNPRSLALAIGGARDYSPLFDGE